MFRNLLNENLMHLKFLSQEELPIALSPLCSREICEIWKQKISTEMTTYLLSPAIPATGLSTGGALTEPSCLRLFTGVKVCKLESSAKQYTTYYNFYFNEKRINRYMWTVSINAPATSTAHIKKKFLHWDSRSTSCILPACSCCTALDSSVLFFIACLAFKLLKYSNI